MGLKWAPQEICQDQQISSVRGTWLFPDNWVLGTLPGTRSALRDLVSTRNASQRLIFSMFDPQLSAILKAVAPVGGGSCLVEYGGGGGGVVVGRQPSEQYAQPSFQSVLSGFGPVHRNNPHRMLCLPQIRAALPCLPRHDGCRPSETLSPNNPSPFKWLLLSGVWSQPWKGTDSPRKPHWKHRR